jgi:RNase adaptor protein for sRNA GlmZ degradation
MSETLTIDIFSFGFQKSGIPKDESGNQGGYVFDCRSLPNPYNDERLRPLSGRDVEIILYFSEHPQVDRFIRRAFDFVKNHAEVFEQRGFAHIMVSFGCTGGQHRSVFCAEQLAKLFAGSNYIVKITHTDFTEDPCAP